MKITDFRKQVSIELIIGSASIPHMFKMFIIKELSIQCAGLTVIESKGYWMEGAEDNLRQQHYAGVLEEEETLHILLTCEENKLEMVYNRIQQVCTIAKAQSNVDISWIHCKLSETYGAHFKI